MSTTILPDDWPRPKGYANGMTARGQVLAIAGMIGWDTSEVIVSDAFVPQFRQALANVVAVVEAAGATYEAIISLTLYVTDKHAYLDNIKDVGAVYRELMPKHYPAMALVQVSALVEDRAQVEIQGLAVLPEDARR
ncbi:MAG: RidA family protein [Nannocystaceae bacterium]|nr:RidA family protein [bacterium]